MWSEKGEEEGHPLTLISKADPGSPAGPATPPPATPALVKRSDGSRRSKKKKFPGPPSAASSPTRATLTPGSLGGARRQRHLRHRHRLQSGDIYFYSPEQLDGDRGVPGQENLYDYREGAPPVRRHPHPEATAVQIGFGGNESIGPICSAGPIARMEVTPDDTHMAFLTATQLTSYDNAGHLEMYSYTPATGALVCDSCNPDGRPPPPTSTPPRTASS